MGHMVKYPDRRDGTTLFDFYGNVIAQGIAGLAFTAKGDIPVGTGPGAGVMEAVGSNGQFLTADSSQTTGVKWVSVSSLPPSGAASGDLSGLYPGPTVVGINGTNLAGLATGLLKNTTGSGIPSIAVAGTDYLTPTGNGSGLTGITISQVSGGMAVATYDPAGIAQQLVGTTATQTMTNKTLTSPAVTSMSGTMTNVTPINNAVTVTSNAGTVPVTSKLSTFTNSSAAPMTITIATASATDGQPLILRIYDASAVAEAISFVNTENSKNQSVPATSAGSTTIPLVVGFMFNAATTKWTCVAVA